MFNAAIINIGLSLSGGHSFSSIKVLSPDQVTYWVDPVKLHTVTVIVPIKKVLLSKAVETCVMITVNFCLCHSGYQKQTSHFSMRAVQQDNWSIQKLAGWNDSAKLYWWLPNQSTKKNSLIKTEMFHSHIMT